MVSHHGRQEPTADDSGSVISRRLVSARAIRTGPRKVSRDQNRLPSTSLVTLATRKGANWARNGNTAPSRATDRVVAEPVRGLAAQDAVPEIVILADNVGVGWCPRGA